VILLLCVGGIFWTASQVVGNDYQAGKCIKRETSGSTDRAVPADCGNSGSYKILDRVDHTTTVENGACPAETTEAFINFKDKYVLCLRKQG
jgi:hypothetical protein